MGDPYAWLDQVELGLTFAGLGVAGIQACMFKSNKSNGAKMIVTGISFICFLLTFGFWVADLVNDCNLPEEMLPMDQWDVFTATIASSGMFSQVGVYLSLAEDRRMKKIA